MTIEHRSAGGALVRANGPEGVVTIRAISYHRTDEFGSVWLPGCLSASFAKRLPVLAAFHDWSNPIGRATSWKDALIGPEVTGRLDVHPDVPMARQVAAQLASGTLTDFSIGFENAKRRSPTKDEEKRWPGVTEVISSADCVEISVVLAGAVPGAELISMRSSRQQLQRDLAAGRITPAQYRAWVRLPADLDAELDAALDKLRGRGILPWNLKR